MSWRVVVIRNRAKLELRMNHLVVRNESETRIHLNEMSVLIVEDTSVSITAALLSEMAKRKIKVVFCDEKRMPSSELVSYYGSHDTSEKVKKQTEWKDETKQKVWSDIVREKITKQAQLLALLGRSESALLLKWAEETENNDITNREGAAAKVYFAAVFGSEFTREKSCAINAALNYGYTILLSAFNREVVSNGYITQLGICHRNKFNQFNLSSDIMEPFRPICDRAVYEMYPVEFGNDEKKQLADILNEEVVIDGKKQYVNNAIKIYTKSVLDALSADNSEIIRFYENEL